MVVTLCLEQQHLPYDRDTFSVMMGPFCDGCTHYDSATTFSLVLQAALYCAVCMYDILLVCFTQALLASPLISVTSYIKLSSRLPSISLSPLKLSIFAANSRHLHLHKAWTPETACLKVNYSTPYGILEWIDKITEMLPVSAAESIVVGDEVWRW